MRWQRVHACAVSQSHAAPLPPSLPLQLLVHMACVALHIDDFKCAFEPLCKDLAVSAEDVTDKFRLLGCSVSRNVAKMKLPIVWPVSRKRARA